MAIDMATRAVEPDRLNAFVGKMILGYTWERRTATGQAALRRPSLAGPRGL